MRSNLVVDPSKPGHKKTTRDFSKKIKPRPSKVSFEGHILKSKSKEKWYIRLKEGLKGLLGQLSVSIHYFRCAGTTPP